MRTEKATSVSLLQPPWGCESPIGWQVKLLGVPEADPSEPQNHRLCCTKSLGIPPPSCGVAKELREKLWQGVRDTNWSANSVAGSVAGPQWLTWQGGEGPSQLQLLSQLCSDLVLKHASVSSVWIKTYKWAGCLQGNRFFALLGLTLVYFYHIIKIDTSKLPIPMVYRSVVVWREWPS